METTFTRRSALAGATVVIAAAGVGIAFATATDPIFGLIASHRDLWARWTAAHEHFLELRAIDEEAGQRAGDDCPSSIAYDSWNELDKELRLATDAFFAENAVATVAGVIALLRHCSKFLSDQDIVDEAYDDAGQLLPVVADVLEKIGGAHDPGHCTC